MSNSHPVFHLSMFHHLTMFNPLNSKGVVVFGKSYLCIKPVYVSSLNSHNISIEYETLVGNFQSETFLFNQPQCHIYFLSCPSSPPPFHPPSHTSNHLQQILSRFRENVTQFIVSLFLHAAVKCSTFICFWESFLFKKYFTCLLVCNVRHVDVTPGCMSWLFSFLMNSLQKFYEIFYDKFIFPHQPMWPSKT